jgi:hypothetical protein
MKIVYITEKEIQKEIKNKIKNLKEEDKTDFIFNNEILYNIGSGHSFGFGFYNEYLTKTGITAIQYFSGKWVINNKNYNYINNEFIEIITEEVKQTTPINFDKIEFPVVKQINAKLLISDLISVKPKNKTNE